ncbi:MAG: response regulator [Puniceicoccaceae bacterium]
MRPLPLSLLLLLLVVARATIQAVEPYEPVRPSPLEESWRWHLQELLEGMTLIDCLEREDGNLWFVGENELVHYNGSEVETFPVDKGDSLMTYRAGEITRAGVIYMLIPSRVENKPGRIVEFKDGTYRDVYRFSGRYDMTHSHAVLTEDDAVLFGTPDGILMIKDGEARIISPDNRRASFLLIDSRGDLWTATVGTGSFQRYRGFSTGTTLTAENWETFPVIPVTSHLKLAELPDGTLLCANDDTRYGLYAFEPEKGLWEPLSNGFFAEEQVHRSIHVTPDGTLMIYGDSGILLMKNGLTRILRHDDFDFPISSPFVRPLSTGSVIIGGRRDSVYLVDCSTNWWETFQGLNFFCTDTEQRQWFISFEGQIVCRDTKTDRWLAYDDTDGAINTPLALIGTADGRIWAVGQHGSRAALSIFHNGQWDIRLHPEMGVRFSHQSLLETRDGSILLGGGDETYPGDNRSGRGGLLKYEVNGDDYTVTHYAPPRVPFRIVGIQEGPDGTLWIGGSRLSRLDDFKAVPLPSEGAFNNSWIDSLLVTETGELWVAQWGVGILHFDGESWHHSVDFNMNLTRDSVTLLEDKAFPGQVWVGTSEGLFNLSKDHWVNEPLSRNLRMLREGGSLRQSPDGAIWFNSSSRNWHFRSTGNTPDGDRFAAGFRTTLFRRYAIRPETRIVEFESSVHEPGLNHFKWTGSSQWSITPTDAIAYSYRIDGGEWSKFTKQTEVIIGTQSNGAHTFEVRARTPYGNIDATPASVDFRVIPVLWKQPWFILLSLAVFLTLIGLVVIIVRQRINHLLALEEYKIQFFTNISHELRTPLMVILGPLESLLQQVDERSRQHLEIAHRNARKLVGLLDRLLDFRKAELGKLQTNRQVQDLVLFIRQEMDTLLPLAQQKNQGVEFLPERDHLVAAFDPRIAEVILDNLLTNAIKYTPEGGAITVCLKVLEESDSEISLSLEVADTGPGIPRKELVKVFDPFHRVGGKAAKQAHSTGIGLAHTKSLVEALGGEIHAESPVNRKSTTAPGSRFVVRFSLPLPVESPPPDVPVEASAIDEETDTDEAAFSTEHKPLMLIVEDNDDIREYLNLELGSVYSVLLAENGETGLQIAHERIPDIIVSDVLMPVMDGKELCRKVKADQRTSHIPVILLTALKSESSELEGLESGADDYVTKPVNVALLRKRIENLLTNRRKVREFISGQTLSIAISKDELPVNRVDQEFMAKFINTIEENLRNEAFDVENLAKRMFMSRMTLYRKVKALTGESPGGIIRMVRLKKAAQYLETGSWTVSQVVEQVGFLDMSHFSRSFKKAYGCTPSEYIERYSTGAPR